jgi:hypothetical protein
VASDPAAMMTAQTSWDPKKSGRKVAGSSERKEKDGRRTLKIDRDSFNQPLKSQEGAREEIRSTERNKGREREKCIVDKIRRSIYF